MEYYSVWYESYILQDLLHMTILNHHFHRSLSYPQITPTQEFNSMISMDLFFHPLVHAALVQQ